MSNKRHETFGDIIYEMWDWKPSQHISGMQPAAWGMRLSLAYATFTKEIECALEIKNKQKRDQAIEKIFDDFARQTIPDA